MVWLGLMLLSGSWLDRFLVYDGCFILIQRFVFWWFDLVCKVCVHILPGVSCYFDIPFYCLLFGNLSDHVLTTSTCKFSDVFAINV